MPKLVRQVRCLACRTLNRVPLGYSFTRIPKCGNPHCGAPLPESPVTKGFRYFYRRRHYASLAVVTLIAALLLRAVWMESSQPDAERAVAAFLVALAAGAIVYWWMRRGEPSAKKFVGQLSTDLKAKVDMLALKAWGSREDIESTPLVLNPASVNNILEHPDLVRALLRHVNRVAPGLSVPMMVPRIVVEPLCEAAGQFVEDEEGWVKIVVGLNFFTNMPAARAILCHELCHYVLGAEGIRVSPTMENERLTDVAIFVFGLGDIFLAGYQRAPSTNYRVGHRLGYLSDSEYELLNKYVHELRSSEELLKKAKRPKDHWNWDRSLRW